MTNNKPSKPDIEKWIWTEADFEHMGWHDVRIHAMASYEILFDDKWHAGLGVLLFDIDYVLKWHLMPDKHYNFWISPATLEFQNVWGLKTRTETGKGNDPTWDIYDINRGDPCDSPVADKPKAWAWEVQLHGGPIEFFATGYEQYIRKEPVLVSQQHFGFKERGGASFSKQTGEGQ